MARNSSWEKEIEALDAPKKEKERKDMTGAFPTDFNRSSYFKFSSATPRRIQRPRFPSQKKKRKKKRKRKRKRKAPTLCRSVPSFTAIAFNYLCVSPLLGRREKKRRRTWQDAIRGRDPKVLGKEFYRACAQKKRGGEGEKKRTGNIIARLKPASPRKLLPKKRGKKEGDTNRP